jgi:AcrR family transcriptional regulator
MGQRERLTKSAPAWGLGSVLPGSVPIRRIPGGTPRAQNGRDGLPRGLISHISWMPNVRYKKRGIGAEIMPRIVDSEAQREAVLVATWRTIAKHGIAGATVRRIAGEAGVSTGFISHYFHNKKEVLAGALRLSNERSQKRLSRCADGRRGLEALRAVIVAVLPLDEERRLEWLIWVTFWGSAGSDPSLTAEWRRGRDSWRATLVRLIQEAKADGEIRPDIDPEHEADRLVVLIVGLGLHERSGRFRRRALMFVDEHLQSLIKLHE